MKKGTWIVFGLAVVLGALYFMSRDTQVSVGVKQLQLPSFAAEKIDSIEVTGKMPVKLIKRDGSWKLVLPGEKAREVRADAANVQALLDGALALRSSHYVTNLEEKYKELGFSDEEKVSIKLKSKDDTAFDLLLGKTASGAGRYAKLPDSNDIYVVRGSFWQLTRNGAIDFRDREIWPVKEGEISRLSISKSGGAEIAIVKDDAGMWQFAEGQQGVGKDFRVNRSALESLVRASAGLRASGFVDDDKALVQPVLTVKAMVGEHNHVLEIFADTPEKFLVRHEGDAQIYEIVKHNLERLEQPIESMRDLSVMKFDKATIKELSLSHGKEKVVLKKEDSGWAIIEPKKLPDAFEFDASAAEDIVNMISGLAGERLAGAKDVASSADWQKTWSVELIDDKDAKIHLYIGAIKGKKDDVLVRGNLDHNVYVIKAMRVGALQKGVNAFKKEDFELPPIDENTKGFESLPVDIQRKLLNVTKEKKN